MARAAIGVLVAAGLVAAVVGLRDATLSTHQPSPPGSEVAVVVRSSAHGAEPGQTLSELTEALLLVCRLEVTSDPTGPLEDLGHGRFRTILRPALDRSNRRQFRGCVEDWRVDQLRVDVESMEDR
jgi:hypothetical protein